VARDIQLAEEYRRMGVRVGYMHALGEERFRREVDLFLRRGGQDLSRWNPRRWLRAAGRCFNSLATVSEDISRLAAYMAAREQGMTAAAAAAIGKEVSVKEVEPMMIELGIN
jgi:hypothetical protein